VRGCAGCHPPPHYTNNKRLPVRGFRVPPEHLSKYDILNVPIDTDPRLHCKRDAGRATTKSPRYGRVVSQRLRAQRIGGELEDWFDESRLRDDYVPTGFAGYRVKARAVKGHEFGVKLAAGDKKALIAFLKTLQDSSFLRIHYGLSGNNRPPSGGPQVGIGEVNRRGRSVLVPHLVKRGSIPRCMQAMSSVPDDKWPTPSSGRAVHKRCDVSVAGLIAIVLQIRRQYE